ncbi:Lysine-specific demethylase [Ananas comosus]|uniref:Lysine-specific demethylase n=1 Tax=Ananas comosus TaxID=4615 RepID=A0A199URD3_ANACO|nr:Lysine-specific demethylase [Ananas comosus]
MDNETSIKSLRHRPRENNSQFDNDSEEGDSDCVLFEEVEARWRPEGACRPILDEAPVFYPTEEEFEDPLNYINNIRPRAEPFGICRIVPPPSWKPPCFLKEKKVWQNLKFSTQVQQIDKLQNRETLKGTSRSRSTRRRKRQKVSKFGGNSDERDDADKFGFETGPDFTPRSFKKYADDFVGRYFRTDQNESSDLRCREQELSVEQIEGEYWRIVERPTEEIEVLYGADLDTGEFVSGFPKNSSSNELEDLYAKSSWNLNNFPKLPGSILSFEGGDISGVIVPWLYFGMCFSTFCWHVEDHHLYSLNYLHFGAPKMWYGVPGKDALKFEAAMKKHLPHLFEEQPDLLHNLVTQFSPALLKLEGVSAYRCVQQEREFVLTFPRAYHSGLNCGFNCSEAVNGAPVDWLPHGQNAVELYREHARKSTLSHDKLLLGAAMEAVRAQWNILFWSKDTVDNVRWKNVCGPDGTLTIALKERIEMENARRENLCYSTQCRKPDAGFDARDRECAICHYDLHLSAVSCSSCSDKFACLIHAEQLCSCAWSTRFFLFRYDISELNILVDALGGKFSAVYKCGMFYLGLSLSSFPTKERTQELKPDIKSTEEGYMLPLLENSGSSSKLGLVERKKHQEGAIRNCSSNLQNQQSVRYFPQSTPCCGKSPSVNKAVSDFLAVKSDSSTDNISCLQHPEYGEIRREKTEAVSQSDMADRGDSVEVCLSYSQNVPNKCDYLREDPRVAKVVPRIKCNVEPLEYGVVLSGSLWSNTKAIFPKGFRSRVRYLSVLDPKQMGYYISEILDGGRLGPLFMVTVEQCPTEVFIHLSPTKCWNLVRERVNHEIQRRSSGGVTTNLPRLHPPGSLNGLQMFGLLSPQIIQAIEALDPNHLCTEYWRCKKREKAALNMHHGSNFVLRGLFKKASTHELHALQSVLRDGVPPDNSRKESIQLLDEEIARRQL